MAQVVYPIDMFWEAAKGRIPIVVTTFPVITRNPPINTWVVGGPLGSGPTGTLYPYAAVPSQVTVVSSAASDTAAGVGARTVVVIGGSQPSNLQQIEVINLNGTTPVVSTQVFRHINSFTFVSAVGSNGFPVGDISFSLSGTLVHKIRAGTNRDICSGGNVFSDVSGCFFNTTYWADKYAEIEFQVRDNNVPGAGFVTHDYIIVHHGGDEQHTPFDKAPVCILPNGSVQALVRVRHPNTTVITNSRGAFVPVGL